MGTVVEYYIYYKWKKRDVRNFQPEKFWSDDYDVYGNS